MKLFSKEIEPRCAYCSHSKQINEDQVICVKQGIVFVGYHCRKYKYDPTKRVPPEPAVLEADAFSADDFKIE